MPKCGAEFLQKWPPRPESVWSMRDISLQWSPRLLELDFKRSFHITDIHNFSMITFLSRRACFLRFSLAQFFWSVFAGHKRADNLVHFCGFSETSNQTLKQMISSCSGLERCEKQQQKLFQALYPNIYTPANTLNIYQS